MKRSCYYNLIPLLCLISFLGYGCKNKKEKLGSFGLVIHEKLEELGGRGGVIVIDREGNIATPFNTDGMRRGYVDSDGNLIVKIAPD
jgi:isoaspartyl peptidase/L-asparaginase-like protein (Ntn-hydrolase superfamily)